MEFKEVYGSVVFLDFDGVLNTNFSRGGILPFEDEAVEFLNELLKVHPYSIVLTTSWRECFTFTTLADWLKEIGVQARVVDRTLAPVIRPGTETSKCLTLEEIEKEEESKLFDRAYQIECWISQFNPTHYLILDDFEMSITELEEHRIKRSNPFEQGGHIQPKDLNEALEILRR